MYCFQTSSFHQQWQGISISQFNSLAGALQKVVPNETYRLQNVDFGSYLELSKVDEEGTLSLRPLKPVWRKNVRLTIPNIILESAFYLTCNLEVGIHPNLRRQIHIEFRALL